jgi:hypothetical protein
MKSLRIHEIHTYAWLNGMSARDGRPVTLASVPDADLDAIAELGTDAVWLMGVWERSPAGRQVALEHPGLREDYGRALPGWRPEDVVGSPYAIRRYSVEPRLGSRDELAALRRRLAQRGMRLVLDFVPNHVAIDHPWLAEAPECFVRGTEADVERSPGAFFRGPARRAVFAHGRDPYFPPWTDTAQLDAFSPEYRERAVDTLVDIASQCDGVRCDMAMLMASAVFSGTWRGRTDAAPDGDFWRAVLPRVKRASPGLLVMAEVYWDMEWEMMQQGFDLAYDKRLYDRMRGGEAEAIRGHLRADMAYQERLVRFVENHDEPRARTEFGAERAQAATVLALTLPGAKLLHEGQEVGHRIKLPVQLGRRPGEGDDTVLRALHRALRREAAAAVHREGGFRLREVRPARIGSAEHEGLIAYTRRLGDERRLVVVGWSSSGGQGRIALPDMDLRGRSWRLHDGMDGSEYARSGDEMATIGLHVVLGPWAAHVFSFG